LRAVSALWQNGYLLPAFATTLYVLLISLLVASLTGFAVGIAIGSSARLQQWSGLLLEYLRAIPPPVLIPVIVLLLGYSDVMKISVVALAALWPILLNTIAGIRRLPPLTLDLARSLRLSKAETVAKILVPAAIPSLLLGIRVALPHAIIITLVVEMFTGAPGLGGLIMSAERTYDASGVYGLLVLIGVIGLLLTGLFGRAERLILARWPSR
jgi:ABC-type nitrate/sulfonate/bicarbonate transport system permease component